MKRPNNNVDNEPSESDASKRLCQQQQEAFNEDFAEIEAMLRAQRANSDSTNIEMNHDQPRMNNDRIVNNGNRASNSNGIISHEQKDGESMNVVEDDVGDERFRVIL